MKRSPMWPLLSLVATTAAVAACAEQPSEPTAGTLRAHSVQPTAAGRYIVQFDKNIPAGFATTVKRLGGTVDLYPEINGAIVTDVTDGAAKKLRAQMGVVAFEADRLHNFGLSTLAGVQPVGEPVQTVGSPTGAAIYPRQWNLRQINAETAWAAGYLGSSNVKVAILDTGLDPANPDLAGRIDAENSASFAGVWEHMISEIYFPGAPTWVDLHYHGTHVGATVTSNAVIAAGVTSNVTLIAVKVIGVDGMGLEGGVLGGIMWSVYRGADVINLSLGTSFLKKDMPGYVALINRAVNYANSRGVTIVAAAGNDAVDLDHNGNEYAGYCNAPNVICVAATGPTHEGDGLNGPWTNPDASAFYTNFGRSSISVAAPGGNGISGVSAVCSRHSVVLPVCGTGDYVLNAQGTSMAAAHVAGLAALLVGQHGRNPAKIRSAIQRGAVDLGARGTDARYGKGRIDVMKSLLN